MAEGVGLVSTADITEGAQFEEVRSGLPARRVGGMHTNPAEMLAQCEPALTLVTAEAHRTPQLVRAALEAGSHVLVEKPACVHLAEFEALCDLAESKGLEVMHDKQKVTLVVEQLDDQIDGETDNATALHIKQKHMAKTEAHSDLEFLGFS